MHRRRVLTLIIALAVAGCGRSPAPADPTLSRESVASPGAVAGSAVPGETPAEAWAAIEAARRSGDTEALWGRFSRGAQAQMDEDAAKLRRDVSQAFGTGKELMGGMFGSAPAKDSPARPVVRSTIDGDRADLVVSDPPHEATIHLMREDGRWRIAPKDRAKP
jgi:hypothetical protein